jgi:hypothetical protein
MILRPEGVQGNEHVQEDERGLDGGNHEIHELFNSGMRPASRS